MDADRARKFHVTDPLALLLIFLSPPRALSSPLQISFTIFQISGFPRPSVLSVMKREDLFKDAKSRNAATSFRSRASEFPPFSSGGKSIKISRQSGRRSCVKTSVLVHRNLSADEIFTRLAICPDARVSLSSKGRSLRNRKSHAA